MKSLKLINYVLIIIFLFPDVTFGKESASVDQEMSLPSKTSNLTPPSIFMDNPSSELDKALEKSLEATLNNQTAEFDPAFNKFINEHKTGNIDPFIELSIKEATILLMKRREGRYPSMKEGDLKVTIEKIINKWTQFFKDKNIQIRINEDMPITAHFSAWEDSCKVNAILIRGEECYLSLCILDKYIELILFIGEEEDSWEPGIVKSGCQSILFQTVLLRKFKELKGKRDLKDVTGDPGCRTCLQELIDGLGWQTMVQVFFDRKEFLGLEEKEIKDFFQDMQREIIKDAKDFAASLAGSENQPRPMSGSLTLNEKTETEWQEWRNAHKESLHIESLIFALMLGETESPADYLPLKPGEPLLKNAYPLYKSGEEEAVFHVCMRGPFSYGLAEETILVLMDVANRFPRIKDSLVKNLIERIQEGKVFFGEQFTRPAVAVEIAIEGKIEHCIVINNYIKNGLNADSSIVDGRTMRGVFLASILLGQEAQIYLRQNKGLSWDDPEFNAAFVAQAAELEVLALYRNITDPSKQDFLKKYNIFLDALVTNHWGEVNIQDVVALHSSVLRTGIDYNFLEARVDAIFLYKEILSYLALLEYSEQSLKSSNIMKIQELFQEIGLEPIRTFNDIPPPAGDNVKIQGKSGISEGDLIECVKKTSITISVPGRVPTYSIRDLIDNGIFAELIIEVTPSVKRVGVRINPKTLQLAVIVPAEIKDKESWAEYCDTYELIPGEKEPLVCTNAYQVYMQEELKNRKLIIELQGCIERENSEMAKNTLMRIQKRLGDSPYSLELGFNLAHGLVTLNEKPDESLTVIREIIKNPRLYMRGYRELLYPVVDLAIASMEMSNSPSCVSDSIYLAEIAQRQLGLHLRAIQSDKIMFGERYKKLSEASGVPDGNRIDLVKRELERTKNMLDLLNKEEEKAIGDFSNISERVANMCVIKGNFKDADRWIENLNAGTNARGRGKDGGKFQRAIELQHLITKLFLSFAGGCLVSEDEKDRLFKILDEKQKEDPLNYYNLAFWGQTLYVVWKYKYPENKEYLREAEKRLEQYIAFAPLHTEDNPIINYFLGLVKYHLGKTEDAKDYLGRFFGTPPKAIFSNILYIEGAILFRKLGLENEDPLNRGLSESTQSSEVSNPAVDDLIQNFIGPFIDDKDRFDRISPKDKGDFRYIYLWFLRQTKQLDLAYRQAREWLENLPKLDIGIIEALVRIGVIFNKTDEVMELLQRRFASLKEKDLLHGFVRAMRDMESKEFISALKIINLLIEKYGSKPTKTMDTLENETMGSLYVARVYIYVKLGQFGRAKKDLSVILERGWRPLAIYQRNINIMDQLDHFCNQRVAEIYKKIDKIYDPDTAISELDKILARYPHHRGTLKAKFSFLSLEGRFDEVEKTYLELMEIYPDDLSFREDLAFCCLAAGNPKALDYYEDYLKSGGDINSIRDKMGRACFMAERYREAIEHIDKYIAGIPVDKDRTKKVLINFPIMLLGSYIKLKRWNDAYSILTIRFAEESIKDKTEDTRKEVVGLCLDCCLELVKAGNPDWDKIDEIKNIALRWGEGLGMDKDFKNLYDEIEFRKLELEEKRTAKGLDLKMKKIRKMINRLSKEVNKEGELNELEGRIRELLTSAENDEKELRLPKVREQIKGLEEQFSSALEKAKDRIEKRKEEIARLWQSIQDTTDRLLNEEDLGESVVAALLIEAERLGVQGEEDISRLLDDLRRAKKLADEERKRKKREERLVELNAGFDIFTTVKTLYKSLTGKKITERELEELFRTPWTVLPPIKEITGAINALRKAIIEIEKAA